MKNAPHRQYVITARASTMPAAVSGADIRSRDRFAVADGLRAIAILSVVVNHFFSISNPVFHHRALVFSFLGKWGVSAFFFLSGYLLSAPYLKAALAGSTSLPPVSKFLARRALRILPLYYVGLLVSVLIDRLMGTESIDVEDISAHVLMLHDFVWRYAVAINGPLWTMPVDFEFYLALPLVAIPFCAVAARIASSNRLAFVWASLGTVSIASLVYRVFAARLVTALPAESHAYYTLLSNLMGMTVVFALGIVLALIFELRSGKLLERNTAIAVFCAGLAFLVTIPILAKPTTWSLIVLSVIAAVSVFCFAFAAPSIPFLVDAALSRGIIALASLSYAIYLIHYPILSAAQWLFKNESGFRLMPILAVAFVLVVLPGAYLLHRFVEKPFLILKATQR